MHHHQYLMEALKLAEQRRGFCSPNPAVGAVVVKNNAIIGSGYHYASGFPHAEVVACQNLSDLEDATLYITLEPCCHWGKTPPCTDLILQKGFKKIYYGYQDPNPVVAGKGESVLRQQGLDCQHMPLPQIDDFYKSYSHWTLTQKPWITSKLAISLDAKIADSASKPVTITGRAAQQLTHQWRLRSDAILTSARTIIQDNPSLNVRIDQNVIAKPLYILDAQLSLPFEATVINTAARITVFHSVEDKHKIDTFKALGINCQHITQQNGQLNLHEVIKVIGEHGIHDLWIEAGGKIFNAFIAERLVNKSLVYVAPKLLGREAYSAFNEEIDILKNAKMINWQSVGNDVVCEIDW